MSRNPPLLGDPARVIRTTLGCEPGDLTENVVITPFVPLKSFLRHVDEGGIKELNPRFFYKGFTAKKHGVPVTVILTGVGPSRVGDAVSLLALTPAKRLIFAGAVGGLKEGLAIGDFFLPLSAADGEGYTRYTINPIERTIAEAQETAADQAEADALAAFLEKEGEFPGKGKIFTIGSIAFESRETLKELSDAGFAALEMELSAFFAATARHKMASAALTYVSDLPLKSSLWEEKSADEQERLARAWRLLPRYAMEFAATGVHAGQAE